jgi:hypothetical protein
MFPVRGRRRVDRAGIAAWRSDTARLENVLGSAVPAFVVTALVSGRAGVWDLARRSLRWRVPLRLLLFTAFLPALAIMILLNNVAEEIGWGRIRLRPIPRSSWSAPRRLVDDSIFLAVPRTELQCRNAIMVDHGAGAGHLPASACGQPIDHWLALQPRRLQRVDRRIVPFPCTTPS